MTKDKTDILYDAIDKLYKPISKTLYRYTKNWHDTEDIVQNTIYKAIKNQDSYNTNSSVKSWLFAIAFHELQQYRTKYWKTVVSFDQVSGLLVVKKDDGEDEEIKEDSLDTIQMRIVMEMLPKQQRKVLEETICNGTTTKETAKVMGISERSTTFYCKRDAKRNVRKLWEMVQESLEAHERITPQFKLLTLKQVADIIGISDEVIRIGINRNNLKGILYNKKYYVRQKWIKMWVEKYVVKMRFSKEKIEEIKQIIKDWN